ncbi:MAG: efflux RND transporter periplasmic adaptor subunit [Bacteroidia bacterium]|nr:MAG: efflux RND transporter periplasmic adaptor subunit [Bacteroidia bacterium]
MKKQIAIIILVFTAGIVAGWYFFGTSDDEHTHEAVVDKDEVHTCPMHPQIRQDGFGSCPICGMDLVPVDAVDESESFTEIRMSETAIRLAHIRTMKVSSQIPEKKLELNGRIETDERRTSTQTAHLPGRIERLYITYTGEFVRRGQRLASIYSPELVAAQRELFEALKHEETRPVLVRAARQKLKQWKLSDEQIRQIEEKGEVQTEIDIYADVSGVVVRRNVTTGDYFSAGTVLFEISDLSKVWVVFEAYEEDLSWINVGDTVTFSAGDRSEQKMTARVEFVDPYVDERTRIARVRTSLDNRDGRFRPGMFLNGVIHSKFDQFGKVITVPKTAVLWGGKTSVVYVKKPGVEETIFQFREVVLGEHLGDSYIILDGLKEGEEIAVHGAFSIDAAAQLSGKASLMGRHLLEVEEIEFIVDVGDFKDETPEAFKAQLSKLFTAYLSLSEALIETDYAAANNALPDVEAALNEMDMTLLASDAHDLWMEHLDALEKAMHDMKDAGDIEHLRHAFEPFSDVLAASVESFGVKDIEVYHQFCPMAFDDRGAWWLSDTALIANPYFGDVMLRCGEVKEREFKKAAPEKESARRQQEPGHVH